jgi:hypothetical protein
VGVIETCSDDDDGVITIINNSVPYFKRADSIATRSNYSQHKTTVNVQKYAYA